MGLELNLKCLYYVRTVSEEKVHILNHFTSEQTEEIKRVMVSKHNSFRFTFHHKLVDINKTMDTIHLQWEALL